ncbi:hypothetical protein PR202_gn00767 [Eleusine coracana subsp. coracana]|uniref:Uncharacterized protein n=1 Tax=Eleusine coracana subsp. coracana TaxID=191504 RepID=A0AAV5G2V4_ELECO|nr:hypothetical protein PR202_gn00767 [Eleusine coracana subsp. coracana]
MLPLMIFQNLQHRLRMKTKTMILMRSLACLRQYQYMSRKLTPKTLQGKSKGSLKFQILIWSLGKKLNLLKILIMMRAPLLM